MRWLGSSGSRAGAERLPRFTLAAFSLCHTGYCSLRAFALTIPLGRMHSSVVIFAHSLTLICPSQQVFSAHVV